MNLPTNNNQPLTMSSREIAELTGKRHDHVLRDIQKMIDNPNLGFAATDGFYKPSGTGRAYKQFLLPRRSCDLLVMSYSVEIQAKVYDRWQELESSQKVALPSAKELALMVIKAEEEKEAAMLEVNRLQGVCNTITAQFAEGTTTTVFCKQFNGVNVNQVNNKLFEMGMLIKTKHGFEPSSYSRDQYFKLNGFHEYDDSVGNHQQKAKVVLTKKGAKWLYKAYLSNKLPMKKCWDGSHVHMVFED